jgi:hypothetical protein
MQSLLEQQREFAVNLMASRPSGDGFDAYRSNVFGNWAGALACAYPIVRKIVGEEFFDGMAREYARAHPSASGDLNEYGARLPEFVAAFAHTQDLPYLPDVARMEWLAHRAYYAVDPVPFDFKAVLAVDSDRHADLRPRLAASCALMASNWPLGRIWLVHQDDYGGAVDVDLRCGPDLILVHRPGWRAQLRSLAPGDFSFLQAALAGEALGPALEAAAAGDPDFDASMALISWIDAGVIVRLEAK